MNGLGYLKAALIGSASAIAFAGGASAAQFDIPRGDLASALDAYTRQSGVEIIYSDDEVRGRRSPGAKGNYSELAALTEVLRGTGFTTQTMPSKAIGIVPESKRAPVQLAQAARRAPATPLAPAPGAVETVVVTAQKKSENIQNVPIAVTALSQAQLTERQIAGGPDLLRDVPNMNFGKTNFTGYSIELRGIGTQAISVTTDPAVAVAFNGTPFIRNHFFEQEFYDLQDVEVLRGPQGTLYGRNATAGVVNLKSARPTDSFDAMLAADIGNFANRRFEGMINLPIVGDKLDLRLAGEWTKRDGYSFNSITNQPIDGRDLWSTRSSLRWRPNANFDVDLVWEHFQEDDDRLRSSKQLCKTAPIPASVDGVRVPGVNGNVGSIGTTSDPGDYLSQGCELTSLYSPDAFQVPQGYSLPYYAGFADAGVPVRRGFNPYTSTTQSPNLRVIESQIAPTYRAKNDTIELDADYILTPALTLRSQSGYNHDFLWSTEDYNRFNTAPGVFNADPYWVATGLVSPDPNGLGICNSDNPNNCGGATQGTPCTAPTGSVTINNFACSPDAVFCDPQLGCSDRLLAEDLSEERAWQASEELRLASNFSGPLNFNVGGNFLHYETVEDYYVFINTLNLYEGSAVSQWMPFPPGSQCLLRGGYRENNPNLGSNVLGSCDYIDHNPIGSLDNLGHTYFLSQNPYVLNSYAAFGELYYNILENLRFTGGLRWTEDQKHFLEIPSELLVGGTGYPVTNVVDQRWGRLTGRAVLNWSPQLDFTDSTLIYGSYAHGYKAGGANPPGAIYPNYAADGGQYIVINPIHPLTFKPEYIEAFELGTKNTLFDDTMTLNGDVFYYNYQGYQISRIVDRTAINDNFNAHVVGAELESTWEPLPGLRFNFAGGWENTSLAGGSKSVDLMDRTAGAAGWMVVKPFVTNSSNCVLPNYVVAELLQVAGGNLVQRACTNAYIGHVDPVTGQSYVSNPAGFPGYPGFDPNSVDANAPANVNGGFGLPPNNGQGFDKTLSGNELPNAPPLTLSFGGEYTVPVVGDWAATFRADVYWQDSSWARVFNDNPYDRLHGYSNLNLAAILSSDDGWQVMGYVKNVFNTTAITGDFLNSDDSGLTTNVFLTDPRLYGIRVTKEISEESPGGYGVPAFFTGLLSDTDGGKPSLWVELGGGLENVYSSQTPFKPSFMGSFANPAQKHALDVQSPPAFGLDEEAKVTYQPAETDWVMVAAVRYGRSNANKLRHQQTKNAKIPMNFNLTFGTFHYHKYGSFYPSSHVKFADGRSDQSEHHLILDFQAGKDVGLGWVGDRGTSTVNGGIRFVQFSNMTNVSLRGEPDVHYPSAPITSLAGESAFKYQIPPLVFHDYAANATIKRNFHGIGPSLGWNASTLLLGQENKSEIDIDWDVNGAVLFGRQIAKGHYQVTRKTYSVSHWNGRVGQGGPYDRVGYFGGGRCGCSRDPAAQHSTLGNFGRSRSVTVSNLGASIALSYRYNNAKISFGYRADEFFGAMDGGIDTRRSENVGFFGPYANISIGLGG